VHNRGFIRHSIARCVATAVTGTLLWAGTAGAQTRPANYVVVLGSGFVCDPNDSSSCAATAKADPGDSYEMTGAGLFDAQARSAQLTGTFAHKSTSGYVLETGVWLANELVSFDSYGAAPGALPQNLFGLRATMFGARRFPGQIGPVPTGGLAVFRIRLLSISGVSRTAVLQVNCALGNVPNERSVEGIRLIFDRNGGEFSEVGGRVMFLSVRPEAITPANPSQQPHPAGVEGQQN
jgi:hypothetical protein